MTQYTSREQAEALIEEFLAVRLDSAGNPPGLREAIESRLATRAETILGRSEAQAKRLRSRAFNRPPTYYAHEEASEDALQAAAAGVRTASAMAGEIVAPIHFERGVAGELAHTAAWAVRSEGARVPRPPTRPTNLQWSLPPVLWLETKDLPWPPSEARGLIGRNQIADVGPALCAEPPYADWVQIGLVEHQFTFESRHPKLPSRRMFLAAGLEISDGQAVTRPLPFAKSRPTIWTRPYSELLPSLDLERLRTTLANTVGPLASFLSFREEPGTPDCDLGAGLHPFLLGPSIELVVLLGLRPEDPALRLCLVDENGPALVCRAWRGFLIHDGNYEPLEPALHGTDLLLRPDLYLKLQTAVDPHRLRLGTSITFSPGQDVSNSRQTDA